MISYLQENKSTKQSGMIFLIYSIRKKLRAYTDRQYIQTVWGVGYTFDPGT